MRPGGKSQHEDTGMGIAETGYRSRPIVPVQISAALLASNLLSIRNKTRTFRAADDLGVEDLQDRGHEDIVAGGLRLSCGFRCCSTLVRGFNRRLHCNSLQLTGVIELLKWIVVIVVILGG